MQTQTRAASALSPQQIETVVASTADAVEAEFFAPSRGCAIAAHVRRLATEGHYTGLCDPAALAERVTADMQAVQPDLHLRLVFRPDGVIDQTDEAAEDAFWQEEARRTAGGVRGVHRLDGDIALLDLAPALSDPRYGGEAIVAAMQLVADAAALVIDLRDNRGGTPEAVALICGYLFGPEPVHLIDVESAAGTHQHWTPAWVPGRRFGPDKPLLVLVSGWTFSGGEELAFDLQELGRARVVGEQTRGGAHPRVGVRVHSHLEATVPCARSVSPRSGTNWEGVGILPDLPVAADEALDVALRHLATDGT
ncbi:N-terminal domain of Peptidase_S41 [Actinopolymorpha cephalotaxi]|uniref:N-terminal domain of Peptidase_S41 n=1 Tax=Actinopolymorpha cephalotaxi TaxID=504797 RepID=A0A1I3AQB0_9ACTN|nr:S41 family peptidase [Actinopolymorpha cephalotaxi]NYH86016.1 hypothetical protein [Actinopolymorpha cephalotaxi]SFH52358.1 N-terminal domain of Peptidase_S41 [Actinopolymorpha cephalotaxi]